MAICAGPRRLCRRPPKASRRFEGAQTTSRTIELIVGDDASTDGTADFLRRKARDDSRLIYFSNSEPRGAPASRNSAIMRSQGTFITGLDDDDEFLPERIGAFVDYWKLL